MGGGDFLFGLLEEALAGVDFGGYEVDFGVSPPTSTRSFSVVSPYDVSS